MKISIMLMVIAISLIGYCETKPLKDLKLGDEVITSVTNVVEKRIWKTTKNGVLFDHRYSVLEDVSVDSDGNTIYNYELFDKEENKSVYGFGLPNRVTTIDWGVECDLDEFNGVTSSCLIIQSNEYGFLLEDSFKEKFKDIELSDESSATIKELHNVLYSILIMLKN